MQETILPDILRTTSLSTAVSLPWCEGYGQRQQTFSSTDARLFLPGLCLLQLKEAVGVLYSRLREPAELQLKRVRLSAVQLLKLGLT